MKYIKNTITMFYKTKLRGSYGRYYPIAILLCYIFCIVEFFIRRDFIDDGHSIPQVPFYSVLAMAIFFVVMGTVQLIKYRLWVNFILGILLGLGTFMSMGQFVFGFITLPMYAINFIVLILFVIINWQTIYSHERFETNARRLFKLAAELISETSNGYTQRPFAAGKVEINQEELQGFVRFINGKFIARALHRNNLIYLIFSMNKSVVKIDEPDDVSYIQFAGDGEVSVRISEKDYHQYSTSFNFNQLNENMASVFFRFLNYYKDGNEARILTELKTAR